MTNIDPVEFLALDVGDRRIGVARANSLAKIAEPMACLDLLRVQDVPKEIQMLVGANNSSMVVVGYPRGLQGQITEQTRKIEAFAKNLSKEISVSVVFFDESSTTKIAEARKKALNDPRDEDSIAAAVILEDFLEDYTNTGELNYV